MRQFIGTGTNGDLRKQGTKGVHKKIKGLCRGNRIVS